MSAFTNYCIISSDIESENKKIDLKKKIINNNINGF